MNGFMDFVLNGRGHGVGEQLQGVRWEPGLLQPYIGPDGRKYVTLNTGKMLYDDKGVAKPERKAYPVSALQAKGVHSPVFNATSLTKDAWIELGRAVQEESNKRLRAWQDLLNANQVGGFNAMARLTYEYQTISNAGIVNVDIDGMTAGQEDRPLLNLRSVPLPITHSDFSFSAREIAVSRNSGAPLDTTMARQSARRVAETIEQMTIGTLTAFAYGTNSAEHTGTSAIYGYTNFPARTLKTDLTTPTGSNPEAVMTDVLEMVQQMQNNNFFGPYMLYHSTPYSLYLNNDYFRSGSTSAVRSVRERVMQIEGIQDIRRLDYLTTGYQLILVQMTSDVAQAINGMPITVVQWETMGGMRQHFKVMCIMLPLLKAHYSGVTGIVHGTTS